MWRSSTTTKKVLPFQYGAQLNGNGLGWESDVCGCCVGEPPTQYIPYLPLLTLRLAACRSPKSVLVLLSWRLRCTGSYRLSSYSSGHAARCTCYAASLHSLSLNSHESCLLDRPHQLRTLFARPRYAQPSRPSYRSPRRPARRRVCASSIDVRSSNLDC